MAINKVKGTLDIEGLKEHLQNIHVRLERLRGHL